MSNRHNDISNAAMRFITASRDNHDEDAAARAAAREAHCGSVPPAGYKVNPYYVECMTHRLQVMVEPSLWREVTECARRNGLAASEVVRRVCRAGLSLCEPAVWDGIMAAAAMDGCTPSQVVRRTVGSAVRVVDPALWERVCAMAATDGCEPDDELRRLVAGGLAARGA